MLTSRLLPEAATSISRIWPMKGTSEPSPRTRMQSFTAGSRAFLNNDGRILKGK